MFVVFLYVCFGVMDVIDYNFYGLFGDIEDIFGYLCFGCVVGQALLCFGLGF